MSMTTGGILAWYDWTPEERAEANRQTQERRQREQAAEEWGAELRRRCSEIDALAGKYMAPQLERHKPNIRPADKQRFHELQAFCAENDWPTRLPILPHALYEYLVSENVRGYKHILSIAKSIARCHELASEDACPTRDPLVKSYLDLVRDEDRKSVV